MTFFPLPLFPDFSLPSSIMVTVFIGVWVLCFINLRFGWPLSGLVVPGFVAPILLAQPQSAAFILAEGTCTYLLARGVSQAFEISGVASPFFGRDRFFLIVRRPSSSPRCRLRVARRSTLGVRSRCTRHVSLRSEYRRGRPRAPWAREFWSGGVGAFCESTLEARTFARLLRGCCDACSDLCRDAVCSGSFHEFQSGTPCVSLQRGGVQAFRQP